jgi:hypothetical protein
MKYKTYSIIGLFTILCLFDSASLPAGEAQDTGPSVSESESEARAILMEMAGFLSNTQRFKMTMHSAHDTVQRDGQKIEFGEIRNIIVSRPDHLRIEVERSDGNRNLVLYDGNNITVNSVTQNVYAQTEKTGGIDVAVTYFIQELHMHLPLAVLLISSLGTELGNRVQSIDYVESTNILGVPAHHLAGRTETVDFQVWVEASDRPLPLRVVLTYKNADGQPQYRAQFSDWDLAPEISNAVFEFTPPKGAQKISFLNQLQNVAVQQSETSEQAGE